MSRKGQVVTVTLGDYQAAGNHPKPHCGISSMSVLDYVAGAQQPHITELPPDDPTPNVEISYDGWVFPKGGLAFVWALESRA